MPNARHRRALAAAQAWGYSWREIAFPAISAAVVLVWLLVSGWEGWQVALVTLGSVAVAAVLVPVALYVWEYATAGKAYREAREEIADLKRRIEALEQQTGTLIPPNYAAIITGEQSGEGQWIPPGLKVTMGPEAASDDLGNSAIGARSRVFGGTGNTAVGGAITGHPNWWSWP